MGASLIGKLLGWIGLPQWVLELIVIGCVAGGIWFWHHETFNAGIAQQVARDNAAMAKIESQVRVDTMVLQQKAASAEHIHDHELNDLRAYRDSNAVVVRLCSDPHDSGTGVPQAGSPVARAKTPGAATPGIQQVPEGDTGVRTGQSGRDIGPLLIALSAAADAVSANLREAQAVLP